MVPVATREKWRALIGRQRENGETVNAFCRKHRRDRLKVLYWDNDGLAIWYKRLERGGFQLPTDIKPEAGEGAEITISELQLLLGGVELAAVKKRKRYENPNQPR